MGPGEGTERSYSKLTGPILMQMTLVPFQIAFSSLRKEGKELGVR